MTQITCSLRPYYAPTWTCRSRSDRGCKNSIASRAPFQVRKEDKNLESPLNRSSVIKRRSRNTLLATGADRSDPEVPLNLRLELPLEDAQTSIKFSAIPYGRGKAIIVDTVAPGSLVEAAGARSGQRLLAVSDPIRSDEVWPLNEMASLRYVRDAIRMRRGSFIILELSTEPLAQPVREEEASLASGNARVSTASDDGDDLLSAIASEAESSLRSSESDDEQSSSSMSDGSGETLGERLQREYAQRDAVVTASEQRMQRRQEYMEQVSGRNDTPFFAGLLALFLLPALGILAVASSSGYLDKLSNGWR